MRGISLHPDQTSSQDLSLGALSYTASYGKRFKLDEVLINFSQNVSETVTVIMVSANGANYNVPLDIYTLGSESRYIFRPTGEANFQAGDKIKVQCTNANLIGIAYLTIKSSMLGSGG